MPRPRPQPFDIAHRREFLLELWRDTHADFRRKDEFLNLTFQVWPAHLADDLDAYHPARAASVVDRAVDNIFSTTPIVHRPKSGDAEVHQQRADRIESFVAAAFRQTALLEPVPTGKQIARHLVAYGYTVVEGPYLDRFGRPEAPARRAGESDRDFEVRQAIYQHEKRSWMPFRLKAPHPSWVLLDPMEKQPRIAIKHAPVYAHRLEEWTRELSRLSGRGSLVERYEAHPDRPFEEVMCDEWWDEDWHALMTVDGQMLFSLPNPGKYVPFGHAFSGWGQVPTEGASLDPRWLAHGILDNSMESLVIHAQHASARHNAMVLAAHLQMATSGDAETLEEQRARGPNATLEIPEGPPGLWPVPSPSLDASHHASAQLLERELEFDLFPPSLIGIREPGVSTVGQQAILSTAALRRFATPQVQMEHLYTNAGSNLLRLLDILGERLSIEGNELSPADLDHDYSLQVSFQQIDPVLLMQERQLALTEHAQGLISDVEYWSIARKEDVSSIRDNIIKESVRQMPQVLALLQQQVLREWGLEQALAQLQQDTGLVDTRGNPIRSGGGGNPLRRMLTPDTVAPGPTGQAFAGVDLSRFGPDQTL